MPHLTTNRSLLTTLRGCLGESVSAFRLACGIRSRCRLVADIWLSRLLAVWPSAFQSAHVRTIRCRPDVSISYRLNRGDLQSIREIWYDGTYRLPAGIKPRILVDLGANIGLASLWMHKTYGCEHIIAVEADEGNARLATANFQQNDLPATLIHAAIGPRDGTAVFEKNYYSNLGRVVEETRTLASKGSTVEVPMISMSTVLQRLPDDSVVDVVKLDIEGGEEALMRGPRDWLRRVRCIIAELHSEAADCDVVRRILEEEGFQFRAVNADFPGSMTMFVRPGPA